jgi:hypothetical protein
VTRGSYLRYCIAWGFRILVVNIALGGGGLGLIAYELVADRLQLRATGLDKLLSFVGPLLTFTGVALTAASIFFPIEKATKPDPISKPIALIVILCCFFGVYALIAKQTIPDNIVNGFALLGLAGALLRIQPNPQISVREF